MLKKVPDKDDERLVLSKPPAESQDGYCFTGEGFFIVKSILYAGAHANRRAGTLISGTSPFSQRTGPAGRKVIEEMGTFPFQSKLQNCCGEQEHRVIPEVFATGIYSYLLTGMAPMNRITPN